MNKLDRNYSAGKITFMCFRFGPKFFNSNFEIQIFEYLLIFFTNFKIKRKLFRRTFCQLRKEFKTVDWKSLLNEADHFSRTMACARIGSKSRFQSFELLAKH